MERAVALKRLRRMLGKEFAYQFDPRAPEPERRIAAINKRAELVANKERSTKALNERYRYLLDNDAEYQRLSAEAKVAREALSANEGFIHRRKITVGTSNRLFFHVKADGDSWEEIFEKLKKE